MDRLSVLQGNYSHVFLGLVNPFPKPDSPIFLDFPFVRIANYFFNPIYTNLWTFSKHLILEITSMLINAPDTFLNPFSTLTENEARLIPEES